MSRINTNINSMRGIHDLRTSNADLSLSLERLSSGFRINRAADDPAGLIISELLRADIASIRQAVNNTTRAVNVVGTAEGALNEVNALLVTVRDLVVEAASTGSLTEEEIEANQLQIDSAVESIARIAKSANFGGTKLLNGNMDYVLSGVSTTQIVDLSIYAVQFGEAANRQVNLLVSDSATKASLTFSNSKVAAITIEIAGNLGTEQLSFANSTPVSTIADVINELSDVTGVTASGGNTLVFESSEYGSNSFISVRTVEGTFTINGNQYNRVEGADADATINGQATVANGNVITLNSTVMDLRLQVADGFASSSSFHITGGGALFQVGGNVNQDEQVNIGIQSIAPTRLGNNAVGFLNEIVTGGGNSLLANEAGNAQKIIDAAILDVASLRGRLGALQLNTLETNINSLEVSLENLTASESTIRDADFAVETANLTRAQILVSAGTSVLAQANMTPQSVLNLLR